MAAAIRRFVPPVVWALWIAVLVCVPITSTPLLSQTAGGETPVGPLSLLPLLVLAIIWLVPYIASGGRFPGLVKPLLIFAVASVMSAGLAAFLPILPYKGQLPIGREVRALITLAIGLTFYVCTLAIPMSEAERRSSVRAIYVGGMVALAWSTVQGWVALSGRDHVPLIVTQIHHWFSVRDPLLDRVTGMAYEPSWLGNQLMVLYIPLLLSAVLQKQSVFPWKRGWLSLETVMLLWAMVILALTQSRVSQISFLVLASVTLIVLGWIALRRFQRRVGLVPARAGMARRMVLAGLNAVVLAAIVVGLFLGAGAAASRLDPRLWALASIQDRVDEIRYLYPNDVTFAVGDRLAFAERLVYWTSAYRTFSLFPVIGVGPGNAGFFFEQTLPDYGLRLTEIRALLREPSFGFPNPKNLWVKLLAETGLVGFLLFAVWLIATGIGAAVLWKRGAGFDRYLGLAAMIAFLTQIIEGFSLDTFALPQLWIVFGLSTAALWRSGLLVSARAGAPNRKEPSPKPSVSGAAPA